MHDVDDLLVPYLPDPMAAGFALVFYEAGADHVFDDPGCCSRSTIAYAGSWPEVAAAAAGPTRRTETRGAAGRQRH